jgi:hypothetical protein
MTKESGQQFLRIWNAAMSAVAVFLMISVFNRFERLSDTVTVLQINQSAIMTNQDMIKQKNSLIDATFENQLKSANRLFDDLNDCEMRLDYLEIYCNTPKRKTQDAH